jgi:hypothetical protein
MGAVKSITIDDVIHYIEFYTNAKLNNESRGELCQQLAGKPNSFSLILEFSMLVFKFDIRQDKKTISAQLLCGLN